MVDGRAPSFVSGPRLRAEQLVISVEHASSRVPARLRGLGLAESWLRTHHGWDPGAALVGRRLARVFEVPLHLGRWSRLVADLNRSSGHPRVAPKTTGGRPILANADLDQEQRRRRLVDYWWPYRDAVGADLDSVVERFGRVLHLSVHSFTPQLVGAVRTNHFGLLYKPSHSRERAMADRWDRWLTGLGFRVRRNYPYSGLDDGFCMRMRAERAESTYLGMEIEMNQRWVRRVAGVQAFGDALVEVLTREMAGRP